MTISSTVEQNFLVVNQDAHHSLGRRLIDYTSQTNGARRVAGLIGTCAKLANYFREAPSEVATKISHATHSTSAVLGIVRLPATTKDAVDALSKLGKKDQVPHHSKIKIAIRDALDAISSWCGAVSFIAANPLVNRIAQIADFGSDTADLCLSVEDYKKAAAYEAASSGNADTKEGYGHARKYYMLRTAKAVLSFSAAFFAVVSLVTGMNLIPVVCALFLSLVAAAIAIRRDVYKEEGRFHLIDINDPLIV